MLKEGADGSQARMPGAAGKSGIYHADNGQNKGKLDTDSNYALHCCYWRGDEERVECIPDITIEEINGYAPLMKNGTMGFVTAEKARKPESRAAFLYPVEMTLIPFPLMGEG